MGKGIPVGSTTIANVSSCALL